MKDGSKDFKNRTAMTTQTSPKACPVEELLLPGCLSACGVMLHCRNGLCQISLNKDNKLWQK